MTNEEVGLCDMPDDILFVISKHLTCDGVQLLSETNKTFRKFVKDNAEYLKTKFAPPCTNPGCSGADCPYPTMNAIARRHLVCVKKLSCGLGQEFWNKFDNLCMIAVSFNALEILQFLLERKTPLEEEDLLTDEAAKRGNWHCYDYLVSKGFKVSGKVAEHAARYGNLGRLMLLRDQGHDVITMAAMTSAAESGHLNCVQFLYENGCTWDSRAGVCTHEGTMCGVGCRWLVMYDAAIRGHLHILKYLHERGFLMPDTIMPTVVSWCFSKDKMECIKFISDAGCARTTQACVVALEYGQLEVLQFLHKNGFLWDEETTELTYYCRDSSRFACVQYAIENGCSMNARSWSNDIRQQFQDYVRGNTNPRILEFVQTIEKMN
jgi:hypothetical protein